MKIEPKSHFFTAPGSITQSLSQAFGPIISNETTKYRITNKFTATSSSKAFAICTGVVLIQPQTGSNSKVNLILKPYKQPILGLDIKYFIYRGLNKNDFFVNDKVIPTSNNTSDFINKININFADFHSKEKPIPAFESKFIGFDSTQTGTLLLDSFFFNITEYVENNGEFTETNETAFELPIIERGKSLGNFVAGECGLDVVLNYGDYKSNEPFEFQFDLAYARAAEAIIDISVITDAVEKKITREQITQFLDVAAYFGAHHCENGAVIIDNAGSKETKTFNDIYTNVLTPLATKNRLYLYVQSDRARSYNFYENYLIEENQPESLKIGDTETTLTEQVYGHYGWPVIVDEGSQNHNEQRNKLFIQFVTDGNVGTMLYGFIGQIDNATKNNFINADYLLQAPDSEGNPAQFTEIITVSNPATGSSGQKYNVAGFNILLYQGVSYPFILEQFENEEEELVNVLSFPNFFDDVFDLINAEPRLKIGNDSSFSIISSKKTKLIHHYYDKKQQGISVIQTIRVNDLIETGDEVEPTQERVAYITETFDVLNEATDTNSITSDTKTSSATGSFTNGRTYTLPAPYYYEIIIFTDNAEEVRGIKLNTIDNSIPNKIIVGLTKTENDEIKSLIAQESKNPRLFLIDLLNNGNDYVSSENINYQKYKIGIVAENNDGHLFLSTPEDEIIIYSLDRCYHFTSAYSQFMLQPVTQINTQSIIAE